MAAQTAKTTAHIGPSPLGKQPFISKWSDRYRGATVEDLDPPPALSVNDDNTVSDVLIAALGNDYTHLTVLDPATRALKGYVAIPALQAKLDAGAVQPGDRISAERAMTRFKRGRKYAVITPATPLEELEQFFDGGMSSAGQKQDFAVVTDPERKFVLGVATKADLEEFVKRRPA